MAIAIDDSEIERASRRMDVMAQVIGLDVPAACRDGVLANLALLDSHAERLAAFVQNEAVTPALKFRP